jgi:hypothetical protein
MFDPDSLTHSIASLMSTPGKAPDMARAWARAYASYAIDGTTVLGGHPVTLDAAQATLQGALTGIFANPYQLAPQTASQMAAAFTAFWLLPPVATLDGAFPGVVTAVAGTGLLQTALVSAWVSNLASRASGEQAARGIAAALDAFSRTVVVTIATVPDPTIGPLS